MCGYVGQDNSDLNTRRLHYIEESLKDYVPILEKADWLAPAEDLNFMRPKPISPKPVGGIGDFFTLFYKKEQKYVKDWSKFGAPLPWGKGQPYFNATIEKIESYFEEESGKPFEKEVMESVNERPCILFVNRFWENHHIHKKDYYKFERSDKGLIPLAGFYKEITEKEKRFNAFTLITRDPYPAIESIGHLRSPVILDDRLVIQWLNPKMNFQERLELISMPPVKTKFTIDQVGASTVTRRTTEGLQSIRSIQEEWSLGESFPLTGSFD